MSTSLRSSARVPLLLLFGGLFGSIGLPGPGDSPAGVPAFLVGLGPAPLAAQAALGTNCSLREDYREFATRQVTPGNRITYIGGPYLICPDGLRIQADSAVVYEASNRTELIGNVRFRHPERELDARLADYYEREGRLFARGAVRFLDVERGSEVQGDTLDYREAVAGRPDDQLTVWGPGTRADLVPSATGPGAPAPAPYRILADRLRFEGEDFFWGDGNVEVDREDLRATSDSLAFDQPGGQLILTGNANVVRGEVVASGGLVNLTLRDDVLESLRARREGRIETDDGTILTGDDVLVRLTPAEEIESVTAEGTDEVRATLTSEEISIFGRNIVIEGAQEETRTIRATGQARGETSSQAPTLSLASDEEGDGSGMVLDHDWIEGQEIVATFTRLPDAQAEAPDPADIDPDAPEVDEPDDTPPGGGGVRRDEYRLERLESSGGARTLYRQPPSEGEAGAAADDDEEAGDDVVVVDAETGEVRSPPSSRWSISYIVAERIVIYLVEGEVDRVEAQGNGRPVDGIQLDPVGGGTASARNQETVGGPGR